MKTVHFIQKAMKTLLDYNEQLDSQLNIEHDPDGNHKHLKILIFYKQLNYISILNLYNKQKLDFKLQHFYCLIKGYLRYKTITS